MKKNDRFQFVVYRENYLTKEECIKLRDSYDTDELVDANLAGDYTENIVNKNVRKTLNIDFHDENLFKKLNDAIKVANKQYFNYEIESIDILRFLKYGIDSTVGERGINFSGGQRQRIAIARALYLEKDILILDEATNSLDSETESKIISNLEEFKDKTIIIISHNLKILENCDKIKYLIINSFLNGKNNNVFISLFPQYQKIYEKLKQIRKQLINYIIHRSKNIVIDDNKYKIYVDKIYNNLKHIIDTDKYQNSDINLFEIYLVSL